MSTAPTLWYLLADCPGRFTPLTYHLAERMAQLGWAPRFIATTPFYERLCGVELGRLGPVHYLDAELATISDQDAREVELDHWLTHPTYSRTKAFWGRHVNRWSDYRRLKLCLERIFDAHPPPQALWSEIPSSATLGLAHVEARRRGIPYLGYVAARVPGHFNVATDLYATELLVNSQPPALESPGAPDYMSNEFGRLATRSVGSLFDGSLGKLMRALRAGSHRSVELGPSRGMQLHAARRTVTRRLFHRLRFPKRFLSPLPSRSPDRLAVVFPLHYRPEASTSLHARFYEDDLQTLRNLAFSMPPRATLYVKEHPVAIGLRPLAFFRDLLDLPNLRLLGIDPPLSASLDRFDAMVCLSSTAGFEAIQRGIPVLLLGRAFYETYPGVQRVSGWEAMQAELARIEPGVAHQDQPEPMRRYLQSCFPGTFDYLSASCVDPGNIELLTTPILELRRRHGP